MRSDDINPFDDENSTFLVLRNRHGQYSLWPDFAPVPAGWGVEAGPDSHAFCVAFVEEHWGPALRPGTIAVERQLPGH
ncbi:MbtH protein [Rhizobium sp. PP-F2F-G38]|uniref:MbtH family protein n=1 Tax=Rhizobium sp. PP-CC-3G-465 TaxID=2135648 RepID=UPI000D868126|nr:MbtH protein [Rhizobium sp. PP-WC-1G-195]PYE94811.1 MbtH protein [Rhizobium sp. PP-F2F-G38]TCQ05370.1 MbtH protein [Rhizobium sp. PP-F2F-G36]TCQ26009.1 MbtH protein [Rhizobium sp. PP-CC-3G-465]